MGFNFAFEGLTDSLIFVLGSRNRGLTYDVDEGQKLAQVIAIRPPVVVGQVVT